jgi:phosphatidylinositol glycan class Z
LAFLVVLGVFNRITFPAYIVVPAFQLLPHFKRKPLALISIVLFGFLTACCAVLLDTSYYRPNDNLLRTVVKTPIITPLNNLLYNVATSNLALHGLHPIYQHAAVNLPQLLGPAYLLIFTNRFHKTMRIVAAVCGTLILSVFPHQEARFLIPAVPLVLSSVKLPKKFTRLFIGAWIIFNVFFGFLMGTFHQGGVVPMQIHITSQEGIRQAFWWKSYSPPIWLLDGKADSIETTDLMGMQKEAMVQELLASVNCKVKDKTGVYLVAPNSAIYLDKFVRLQNASSSSEPRYHDIYLEERWRYSKHLNLDDIDFGEDGVWPTLKRVVGRRGLVLWEVGIRCP